MKISVITSMFNQVEYIAETITSVQELTGSYDVEHIIFDNLSTDGSLGVAQAEASKYEPERVRVYSNLSNLGIAATRNAAIRQSRGDLILPLDSDDWISPEFLDRTVPFIEDGADAVVTWMHITPLWQMITYHAHTEQWVGAPGTSYPIFAPTREQILDGNCLPVCGLIKKDFLQAIDGYPEEIDGPIEDWAMWAKFVCAGARIDVVPEYLFHYRVHAGSASRTRWIQSFDVYRERVRKLCESL